MEGLLRRTGLKRVKTAGLPFLGLEVATKDEIVSRAQQRVAVAIPDYDDLVRAIGQSDLQDLHVVDRPIKDLIAVVLEETPDFISRKNGCKEHGARPKQDQRGG